MRRFHIAVLVAVLLLSTMAPAAASDPPRFESELPFYTGSQFQELYVYGVRNTLPGLDPPVGQTQVTGNPTVDERIWSLALQRGYVPQPVASGDLVAAPINMQPLVAEAWQALNTEARQNGMGFIARSAFRSVTTQRIMFNQRLSGSSDAAIDNALQWAAPPGMSKHHGGYALDFRYPDGTYAGFRATPGYAWLAADNFAVAKRYGFIPSYPDDVKNQGPNPEPWEFVWVGEDLIRCGQPQASPAPVTGPAAGLVADITHCPGGAEPVTLPEWFVP